MQNHKIKLMPCPFCGGTNLNIYQSPNDDELYIVECFTEFDDEFCCGDWHYRGDSKEETAQAWNKRKSNK